MNSTYLYYPLSGLINAITSVILGFFVLSKNKSDIKYITYALFCSSIAAWSIFYFVWLITDNKNIALFCSHGLMAGAIFIPVFYLHHICALLGQIHARKHIIILAYVFAIISSAFNLTPYYITGVTSRLSFKFWPTAGPLFTIFLAMWGMIVIYGAYIIFNAYKNSVGIERNRMKYVLIATLVGWAGGGTNYPLWYNINILPFLNILVSAYIGIVAYAIVRHQLMEIEVIIKKTLVYSILISLITILYFIIVYLLERVFSVVAGYQSLPMTIAIIAAFSIVFTPLKNRIQRYIDTRFFKGTIDQIEKEKEFLETELQRSERLKTVSSLAAGMAHEIKNPLTGIKTFAEYVDKKYNDPEFRQKFKSIVPKEIDKITNIINQLLDYSKTDRISLTRSEMHNILDYVLDLYSNEFIRKNIKIQKLYNAQSPYVTCDKNQMKQAFINIILNSIEAMTNGGELTAETKEIDNTLEVSIQDTGGGIPKEKLKNLFNPFYTTKEKGTGLGLFIAHQIIENNKGSITIDSELNKGTVVRARFPKV